mgnify:FL=1
MKKIFSICVLFISQLPMAQEFKQNTAFNKILEQKILESKIPGLAAAAIYKDTIYYGVAGTISNESDVKINPKTLFHIGSNTKAFTSFLAFQAIENGKLTLETKFFDVYPNLKNESNKVYHQITLADLLAHEAQVQPFTSGLQMELIKITKENPSEKRIEFAEQLLKLPTTEKGTYSNAGYVLASMMIEKVENKPFEEVLSSYLKSNNWDYSFGFPNKKDTKNAWGHWTENNKFTALSPTHDYNLPEYMLAAGDLSMNIEDYSAWLYKHIQEINSKNESFQKMHYEKEGMSYGWGNGKQNGQSLSFHDGSTGTFYTHAILLPEQQIGITIFANAAEDNQVNAIYQLQQELLMQLKKIVDGYNRKP